MAQKPPEIAPERAEAVLAALRFARPGLGAAAVRLRGAVEAARGRGGLSWRVGSPTVRAAHDFGHNDFVDSLRCDCRGPGTRACAHAGAVLLLLAYEYPKTWHLFVQPLTEVRGEPGATRPVARRPAPAEPARPGVAYELRPPPTTAPQEDLSAWILAVLARRDGDGREQRDLLALERHCSLAPIDRTLGDLLTRLHALGRRTESGPAQVSLFAAAPAAQPTTASTADVRRVLGDLFTVLADAPRLRCLGQDLVGNDDPLRLGLRVDRAGADLFDLGVDPPLLGAWAAGPGWVATRDGQLRPTDEGQSAELQSRLVAGRRGVPEEGIAAAMNTLVPFADASLPIRLPPDLALRFDDDATPEGRLHVREETDLLVIDVWVEYRASAGVGRTRLFDPAPFVALSPPGERPLVLARRSQELERRCLAAVSTAIGRVLPCSLRGEAAHELAAGRLRDAHGRGMVLGYEELDQFRLAGVLSPRVDVGRAAPDARLHFVLDERRVPPGPVFRAWRAGQGSVRLPNGDRALLPRRWLDHHGAAWEEVEELRRGAKRILPVWAAPLLHDALHALDRTDDDGLVRVLSSLAERVASFTTIPERSAPLGLQAILRPYQHDGFRWLVAMGELGLSTCLADEMGLGKTVQALAWLLHRTGRSDAGPNLVVAPTSLLRQWADECARFAPAVRVRIHHGAGRATVGASLIDGQDLIITSYGVLLRDEGLLARIRWSAVVLDEAQRIRNAGSRAAAAAFRLHADQRLALTGTPVENDLDELWSLFHFLMPGFFGSRRGFARRYHEAGPWGPDPSAMARLRARIRPFLLRRKKAEVAKDLPPLSTRDLWCTMPEPQRLLYETVRRGLRGPVFQAVDEKGIPGASLTILEALLRLRQAACDPTLLPPALRGDDRHWPVADVAKRAALIELLDEVVESGHRVLVFSQWTSLLDIVEGDLRARQHPFTRLDGHTADRPGVLAAWRGPDGPPIFLLSLKAGGAGLNLQEADHVIHLDPWWNPAVEAQATGRAHRIGQDRAVFVHRLLTRGSLEERVLAIQDRKRGMADALDEDRLSVDEITRDDLDVIFSAD